MDSAGADRASRALEIVPDELLRPAHPQPPGRSFLIYLAHSCRPLEWAGECHGGPSKRLVRSSDRPCRSRYRRSSNIGRCRTTAASHRVPNMYTQERAPETNPRPTQAFLAYSVKQTL